MTHARVGAGAVSVVRELEIAGRQLIDLIDETEVHEILEKSFGVESRLYRVLLISKINQLREKHDVKPKVESQVVMSTQSSFVVGSKSLTMPAFPKSPPGMTLPTGSDWQLFMGDVKVWADISSSRYGELTDLIYRDPAFFNADKQSLFKQLDEQELKMDAVLGAQLRMSASQEIKKLFKKKEDYEFNGITSGLLTLYLVGVKINKQSETQHDTLSKEFYGQEALTSPSELQSKLAELSNLKEALMHQGSEINNVAFFTVLGQVIEQLVDDPKLLQVMALPVLQCKKDHPRDGQRLFECLEEVDFVLRHDPKYKQMMLRKPAPVGGVGVGKPAIRKMLCMHMRDKGECKRPHCKFDHDKSHYSHDHCTDEVYVKHGVCPGYYNRDPKKMCKHKHKPLPEGQSLQDALTAAKAEFPQRFAAGVQVQANPDPDPALSANNEEPQTAASNHDEEGALAAFVVGSPESDSQQSWQPDDTSVDDCDQEIDPALQHLLEDGMSREDVALLERELEAIEEMTHAMAMMNHNPDEVKVLIDGGTFNHMFGTGVSHLLINRRVVPAIPISTAGGMAWVNEKADLQIGEYLLHDGYVNPNMTTTLLSEGKQIEADWTFYTAKKKLQWPSRPWGITLSFTHRRWAVKSSSGQTSASITPPSPKSRRRLESLPTKHSTTAMRR